MLVDKVERIQDQRWDTWVCVKPNCGLEYDEQQQAQIEKEILNIVNNCESDLFYNKHTGDRKYKYAFPVCWCQDFIGSREHWILSNNEKE